MSTLKALNYTCNMHFVFLKIGFFAFAFSSVTDFSDTLNARDHIGAVV